MSQPDYFALAVHDLKARRDAILEATYQRGMRTWVERAERDRRQIDRLVDEERRQQERRTE